MKMTFYTANCRGNAKNSLYPNRRVIDNEDDCMEVVAFDHVCAEFKNCRRSGDNFLSCDVDVMDCDNSHSDNPADWIHPEDLEGKIGKDVAFVVVPSRNNMKPKEGKSARPRFHVYFPHDPVTDGEACASLKKAILSLILYRYLERKLDNRYTVGQIIDTLQEMNFIKYEGKGYQPTYTRTELTDALHEAFGFSTSKEIVPVKKMKKICADTKRQRKITAVRLDHRLCRWFECAPLGHFSVPPIGGV